MSNKEGAYRLAGIDEGDALCQEDAAASEGLISIYQHQ